MLMLRAAMALGLLVGGAGLAAADCASEAKTAMEKRLSAFPFRETIETKGDGFGASIQIEFASLENLHFNQTQTGGNAPAHSEQVFLDGKAWEKLASSWQPVEDAKSTLEGITGAEQGFSNLYTDGAVVTCLGPVKRDGRMLTAYDLQVNADTADDPPFATMHLEVNAANGLPQSFEANQLGEAGPIKSVYTFSYDKPVKIVAPVAN